MANYRLLPVYAVLIAASIFLLAPLILTVFTAFKSPAQISEAPWSLPDPPVLANYLTAWFDGRFNIYFKNSVFISAVDVVLMVPLASMAAYALVFIRIPGRRALLPLFMAGLMVHPPASSCRCSRPSGILDWSIRMPASSWPTWRWRCRSSFF